MGLSVARSGGSRPRPGKEIVLSWGANPPGMQRRAAAAYVALFIVIAAGSYAFIGVAEEPAITLENPDVTKSEGGSFTVDGVEYSVDNISEPQSEEGGIEEGEDDGPQKAVEAKVTWDQEVRETETLEAGQVVTADDRNWTVEIPDQDDPSTFQLVEHHEIDEETVERDGTTYVVVEEDGEEVLVEREQYVRDEFGEPETREFSEGDTLDDREVDDVNNETVTLGRTVTEEQSMMIAEGDEVTLGDTTYVAHFPDRETLELTTDLEAYQQELDDQQRFHDRITGINYLAAISLFAALLLITLAYLPRRR